MQNRVVVVPKPVPFAMYADTSSVVLRPDEDVEWHYTFFPDGARVTGYTITKKS